MSEAVAEFDHAKVYDRFTMLERDIIMLGKQLGIDVRKINQDQVLDTQTEPVTFTPDQLHVLMTYQKVKGMHDYAIFANNPERQPSPSDCSGLIHIMDWTAEHQYEHRDPYKLGEKIDSNRIPSSVSPFFRIAEELTGVKFATAGGDK